MEEKKQYTDEEKRKIFIRRLANGIINGDEGIWIKEYEFTENNKPVFVKLLNYFSNISIDEIDCKKGIALSGTMGSGKTTIMRIFQVYTRVIDRPNPNTFKITSMNSILSDMTSNSKDDSLTYNTVSNTHGVLTRKPLNICINEFGAIEEIKIYGSDAMKIFENFMMIRYEIFQDFGKKTHITTNLTGSQLQKIFSPILIDRFKEMFNMIPLTGKSFRV